MGEEVFTSTQYTSFDLAYLMECDQQLLYNPVSFNGLANAYNGKHRTLLVADGRQPYVGYLESDAGRWLNDERLGDAWFKWTLGKFLHATTSTTSNMLVSLEIPIIKCEVEPLNWNL
jgi:hypothetical protein